MLIDVVIAVVVAVFGLFVSSLHYALGDFSWRKLEELCEKNGGTGAIDPIVNDSESYALSMGALRSLCAVILVCAVCYGALESLVLLKDEGAAMHPVGAFAIGGGVSLVLIVLLFVILPISIAEHAGERLIHASPGFIKFVHGIMAPLRALAFLDKAIERLAGRAHVTEKEEAEDELLSVAAEAEREGTLQDYEKQMIESIVRLSSKTVEEMMTPRTEIEGFELTDDLAFIRDFIEKAGHSRIPVYEGDYDHIAGILYAKDLLKYLGVPNKPFHLKPILREALFVPESKSAHELLVELQQRKVHMAIVLDEYGGTTGLITFEDILEEIVGEIYDEYEPEDESEPDIFVDAATRSARMHARATIEDANEALEAIGIELPESEDYDTVGGYVLAELGHIPQPGETVAHNGFVMTVLEAESTRVSLLRIEAVEPAAESAEAAALEANGNGREGGK
ncbi:MAG: hemolysin family protein, partial [Phycisphaerales bacterium]|nr:HlyC/CorC family transporter [Phycisphaerales bacterium]